MAHVKITIEPNAPPPPVSNANYFDYNTGDKVEVDSMEKLAAAVNNAPSTGRQVLIPAGTYDGSNLNLRRSGQAPVVIRPKDGRGSVVIMTPTWELDGSRIVLANLFFNNPNIHINGKNHRVTRNHFRKVGKRCVQVHNAVDTRVDHNDWSDALSTQEVKNFVWLNDDHGSTLRRVLVDYNYCHDSNPSQGVNGSDFIGLSASNASDVNLGLIIDHNLFEKINLPGDSEMIGAKCSGIIFRFNTCLNTGQQCYINAPRMGKDFEVRSSWFEGTNPDMVHGFGSGLLIGNRFMGGVNMWVGAGDFYFSGSTEKGYPAAVSRRVIGNRMGIGHIRVGGFWSNAPKVPARGTNLWGNTRDAGGDAYVLLPGRQTGTTFNQDNEPYTPAVKLTKSNVGMAARDPLCPSGPQN